MHNCEIEFDNDNFKKYVEQCEPEVKISKIISNYYEIVDKAISCRTQKQCKLFLADCLIYNLMFITNWEEKMLLLLKLNDIWEYIDSSNSLIQNTYIIKIDEYENTLISKQAYKTIYAISKIINEWDSLKAMLNNYLSSNFHVRFSRYHKNCLSILTKFRQNQKGKWIESKKLNNLIKNFNKKL